MRIALDILAIIFVVSGSFFILVGVIGLIRMPDVFCRLHATTKCDTMGAGLIYLGLVFWQGLTFTSLVILVILVFIWLTNPTAAHYIAKSAYQRLKTETEEEDGA